jgi:O-antigen ligase
VARIDVESTAAQSSPEARPTGVAHRVRALLDESPSLPLLAIAVVLVVWISADEGGFHGTTFLPATLVLLALLAVGLLALPRPRPSRAQSAAIALIAGYAAWSYLSILWADQQGLAWDGANRTVMYALALALFALWPIGAGAGTAVAVAYALGIGGLGLVELLRAGGADSATAFFDEGRLSEPTGYANANVALWTTALWPALVLAGRSALPAPLRGLLLACAGLLTALAILGQSRGWLAIMPLMVLVVVAVVPGRGRTVGALALVGAAIAAIAGPLLDVYPSFDPGEPVSDALSAAVRATLIACVGLFVVGTAWGLVDRSGAIEAAPRRQLGRVLVIAFALCCVAGLVAFTAVRGNPASEVADAWDEFKLGGSEPSFDSARLGTLGGTYRYDYWEVAWQTFADSPLIGVGGDNFGREYLIHGESRQTPAYPHSVELRVLSQTGLIGFALLLGGIAAAIAAAIARIRQPAGRGAVTAGTGVVVFAYFVVHGSLDWLWEFPALGTPAFALLGLATAIGTRASSHGGPPRVAAAAAGGLAALVLAAGLVPPWLAERDLRAAREVAASDPAAALARLDRAADLNPLSPLADKTAAVIERRQGLFGAAETRLRETLAVDPGDPFVYLQLAVIASATDRQQDAVRLIRRARELNPRDAVTRRVRRQLEAGRHVSPSDVDRMIVRDVDDRIGRQ